MRYREYQPCLAEHTHTLVGRAGASLALSGAPVCGMPRLPEGSRRDTGGGLRDDMSMSMFISTHNIPSE